MAKPEKWIIEHCKDRVETRWGKYAHDNLGDVQYESALNEALLLLLVTQDLEHIDPQRVVEILSTGRTQIIEHVHGTES